MEWYGRSSRDEEASRGDIFRINRDKGGSGNGDLGGWGLGRIWRGPDNVMRGPWGTPCI